MKILRMLSTAILVVVAAATVARAHHSFSMFDSAQEQVMAGEIVRWGFNSPHALIYIKDAKGTTWGFEGAAPAALIARKPKMDGYTFKPRDKVTMIYCPLRDGRPGGAMGFIVTADSTWYNPADGGCRANQANWQAWLASGYTSRAQAETAAKK